MQFLIYILAYPLLWFISILPFRLLYAFSDILYVVIYKIFKYRKRVVKENLNLVFPQKTEAEIKHIMRKFYHHFCDMIVEAIKSLTISERTIKTRFKFKNIEVLQAFEQQKQSVVLMSAHYGSWEWIFILQSYVNFKGYAIYKRLANPYFDKLVKKIRIKYNTHLITTKESVRTILSNKVKGQLTLNGFVADQSPKMQQAEYWNTFLGIKVPMYTGAEILAKRLNMPVVFYEVERVKRGHYLTTFKTITENPKHLENYEITDRFFKLVEAQIHKAPEYYLWTHKRWKHRHSAPKA